MENMPYLISCKPLKSEFITLEKIPVTSTEFTMGRGLNNLQVIPFIAISRNHCRIKTEGNNWVIHDLSSLGIEINGVMLGKGNTQVLHNGDIICMEPSKEFIYKFVQDTIEPDYPRKKIKLENNVSNEMINDVKIKFEQSQDYAMKSLEVKIQNAKHMQTTNMLLKEQLQSSMVKKITEVEERFATQITNLKGEKDEIEKQKVQLEQQKNMELEKLKKDMGTKIFELMEQIKKHNEAESELLIENNELKEKLQKEREEFLAELNRESSSKQDLLNKLNETVKEQENQLQEKQHLEIKLRMETEQLRAAKEKELRELAEAKKKREQELMQELREIRKNLEEQAVRSEHEKHLTEQQLTNQIEHMKKINDEERIKLEQLTKEREEMQKQLNEAPKKSQEYIEELQARVAAREVELAALAAERIQQQADQSGEVIKSLQDQLEKVKKELESVNKEKSVLETCASIEKDVSANTILAQFGDMMESELQCSICAELYIEATTLNCSHTFCKFCITMWKKKKKDCPVCRAQITSECRSIVLDSFIEKAVQNLTTEMKKKREELLKYREEEQTVDTTSTMKTPNRTNSSRRRGRRNTTIMRNTTMTRNTTDRTRTTQALNISAMATFPTVDLTLTQTTNGTNVSDRVVLPPSNGMQNGEPVQIIIIGEPQ